MCIKLSAKSKAFKNLFFSSAGLYIEYFLGMLVSIIIARVLGPEKYGEYALILWLCAFGTIITNGGVTTALIKFVAECRVKHLEYIESTIKYINKIQYIKYFLVLIVFSILYIFFKDTFYKEANLGLLMILLIAIALRAGHMFYFSLAKGFENFKLNALIVSIAAPINLLLMIAAAYYFNSLHAFLAAYIISSLIFFIISKTVVQKQCVVQEAQNTISNELKSRINKHVKIVMLNTLLVFIITKDSELLFLKYFSTPEELGLFKVSHRLSTGVALLLPGIFGAIMLPLMSASVAQSKEVVAARFISSIKYILIIALPAALFFVRFSEEIILLLYGENYIQAVIPFSIIVFTCCVCSIGTVSSSYLLSIDKQSLLFRIVIIGTIVKLVLDYFLVSKYHLMGAVVAFSFSIFLMFISKKILAMRMLGLKFPWGHASRILLAGSASILLIDLIPDTIPVLVYLGVSAIFYFVSFLFLSIMLKLWGKEELSFIRNKTSMKKYTVLTPIDKLLAWASK